MLTNPADTNDLAGATDLTIRPLGVEDARMVSAMLLKQPAEYARFFSAFGFSEEQITDTLTKESKTFIQVCFGAAN